MALSLRGEPSGARLHALALRLRSDPSAEGFVWFSHGLRRDGAPGMPIPLDLVLLTSAGLTLVAFTDNTTTQRLPRVWIHSLPARPPQLELPRTEGLSALAYQLAWNLSPELRRPLPHRTLVFPLDELDGPPSSPLSLLVDPRDSLLSAAELARLAAAIEAPGPAGSLLLPLVPRQLTPLSEPLLRDAPGALARSATLTLEPQPDLAVERAWIERPVRLDDAPLRARLWLPPAETESLPRFYRAVAREAEVLHHLRGHPAILQYRALGALSGQPILLFEPFEGAVSLRAFLSTFSDAPGPTGRPLPPRLDLPTRLRILRELTSAVDHCHRHEVILRDLSPSSLLLRFEPGRGGQLRVALRLHHFEAALARFADQTATQSSVHADHQRSREAEFYASPERLRDARATVASDLYALGALFFTILTGLRPGEDTGLPGLQGPVSTLREHGGLSLQAVSDEHSDALHELVLRLTDPRPDARPSSARAVLDALDPLLRPFQEQVPLDPAEAEPGELLAGELRVDGQLGHGATARVLRVQDRSGNLFALKIPRNVDDVARIRREDALLRSVGNGPPDAPFDTALGLPGASFASPPAPPPACPSLVRSLGLRSLLTDDRSLGHSSNFAAPSSPFFPDDPRPALALSLCGTTLGERLRASGGLSRPELEALAEHILAALDHLHHHDILHRDVKPDNIGCPLAEGAPFTLFDLSLSGPPDTQIRVGTERWRDPEILERGGWDPAADRYSLALVLFYALTGFALERDESGAHRPERRHFDPAYAEDAVTFFSAALHPNITRRPADSAAFLASFRTFLVAHGGGEARELAAALDRATPDAPLSSLPLPKRAIAAAERLGLRTGAQLVHLRQVLQDKVGSSLRMDATLRGELAELAARLHERWATRLPAEVERLYTEALGPGAADGALDEMGLSADLRARLEGAGLDTPARLAAAPVFQVEHLLEGLRRGRGRTVDVRTLREELRRCWPPDRSPLFQWLTRTLPDQPNRGAYLRTARLLLGLPVRGLTRPSPGPTALGTPTLGTALLGPIGGFEPEEARFKAHPANEQRPLREHLQRLLDSLSGALRRDPATEAALNTRLAGLLSAAGGIAPLSELAAALLTAEGQEPPSGSPPEAREDLLRRAAALLRIPILFRTLHRDYRSAEGEVPTDLGIGAERIGDHWWIYQDRAGIRAVRRLGQVLDQLARAGRVVGASELQNRLRAELSSTTNAPAHLAAGLSTSRGSPSSLSPSSLSPSGHSFADLAAPPHGGLAPALSDSLATPELSAALPPGLRLAPGERLVSLAMMAHEGPNLAQPRLVPPQLSPRGELYPAGLAAESALRLILPFMGGLIRPEALAAQLFARFPLAAPLPPRPELDRCVGPGFIFDPEEGGYRRIDVGSSTSMREEPARLGPSSAQRAPATSPREASHAGNGPSRAHGLRPFGQASLFGRNWEQSSDPEMRARVAEIDQRLRLFVEDGGLRVLRAPREQAPDVALVLQVLFPHLRVFDLDEALIRAFDREVAEAEAPAADVETAEAEGPDGPHWRGLQQHFCQPAIEGAFRELETNLVHPASERVSAEGASSAAAPPAPAPSASASSARALGAPLLILHGGLLARWEGGDALRKTVQRLHEAGPACFWLVPTRDPSLPARLEHPFANLPFPASLSVQIELPAAWVRGATSRR